MYIYGKNVSYEALKSGKKINKIYLGKNFNDHEIMNLIYEKKIRYSYVPKQYLDGKVKGLHQGIIMDVDNVLTYEIDEIKKINDDNPIVLMLDHLEDPHNFGAIIRTCEALGVKAIIIPNDRMVGITDTVVKTSAGAIYKVKIIRVANLNVAIGKLKEWGYWIIGTDINGSDYTKMDYNMPVCLIIGNEGKGMSAIVKRNCDYIINIPMVGEINSLNASVACGIILGHLASLRR